MAKKIEKETQQESRPSTGQLLVYQTDDGQEQTIDFGPVLKGALFGPLQDEAVFRQVEIDPERHTLVWPNGADFDPETLHDWPKYAKEMEAMADRWETAAEPVAQHPRPGGKQVGLV